MVEICAAEELVEENLESKLMASYLEQKGTEAKEKYLLVAYE